jgi:hypothetical protein
MSNTRVALTSALLAIGGVGAATALPRIGSATPPPTHYRVIFLRPFDLAEPTRIDAALGTCTPVAMSTMKNANADNLAVLCRQ